MYILHAYRYASTFYMHIDMQVHSTCISMHVERTCHIVACNVCHIVDNVHSTCHIDMQVESTCISMHVQCTCLHATTTCTFVHAHRCKYILHVISLHVESTCHIDMQVESTCHIDAWQVLLHASIDNVHSTCNDMTSTFYMHVRYDKYVLHATMYLTMYVLHVRYDIVRCM